MKTLLILSLLFCAASAQLIGTIGLGASLTANTQTTINYLVLGGSLSVVVDKDCQLTLNLFLATSLNGNLPQGYAALSFTTEIGYTITTTNGAVIVSANLTTPALSVASLLMGNASAKFGCLQVDTATNTYNDINVNSVTAGGVINVPIPSTGTYIFAAVQANVATPNFYAKLKALLANTKATVSYSTNFVLDVTVSVKSNVNVTYYNANPAPANPPARYVALNAYWKIDLDTQATVAATLNYTFQAAQLTAAGIQAAQLKFGFYNTATAQWEFMASNVDTKANVVSQTTTHFSTWGVYGDTGAAPGTGTSPIKADASGILISSLLLLASFVLFL